MVIIVGCCGCVELLSWHTKVAEYSCSGGDYSVVHLVVFVVIVFCFTGSGGNSIVRIVVVSYW